MIDGWFRRLSRQGGLACVLCLLGSSVYLPVGCAAARGGSSPELPEANPPRSSPLEEKSPDEIVDDILTAFNSLPLESRPEAIASIVDFIFSDSLYQLGMSIDMHAYPGYDGIFEPVPDDLPQNIRFLVSHWRSPDGASRLLLLCRSDDTWRPIRIDVLSDSPLLQHASEHRSLAAQLQLLDGLRDDLWELLPYEGQCSIE